MISFAKSEMARVDVTDWTMVDWMKKRMTISEGNGVVADIVWARKKVAGYEYENMMVYGERKVEIVLERDENDCLVERERLMLIKYDGETRQEVQEMCDDMVIWIRPFGSFGDDWQKEKAFLNGGKES